MKTVLLEHECVRFADFDTFAALRDNRNLLSGLIATYREIFSEPDVWNENYSYNDVLEKIEAEMAGAAGLRLCLSQNDEVIGFCWAQRLTAERVCSAVGSIQFIGRIGRGPDVEIERKLQDVVGEEPVVYLHDLGVRRQYRGKVPLIDLMVPVLEKVCQRAGTRRLCFWSVSQTCVGKLADKAGIDTVFCVGDMQFFIGELPSLSTFSGNDCS
jgi:hypothetical protein